VRGMSVDCSTMPLAASLVASPLGLRRMALAIGMIAAGQAVGGVLSVIAPLSGFDGRTRFPDHAASRMRSAVIPRVRKRWRLELVGMFRLRRERGYRWLRSSS
jgi:hypothetical protein